MKLLSVWGKRAGRIVALAAAVVVLLFVVVNVFARSILAKPLENDLVGLPFVNRVQVELGGTLLIQVSMEPVANLREAYLAVEERVNNKLRAPHTLVIEDRRNPELVEAFYVLRPYVLEAIARGNFSEMNVAFHNKATEIGLDSPSCFTVDHRFVYVQLHQGDDYLYVVEPIGNGSDDEIRVERLQP